MIEKQYLYCYKYFVCFFWCYFLNYYYALIFIWNLVIIINLFMEKGLRHLIGRFYTFKICMREICLFTHYGHVEKYHNLIFVKIIHWCINFVNVNWIVSYFLNTNFTYIRNHNNTYETKWLEDYKKRNFLLISYEESDIITTALV
jgi:hypothetical protein